MSFFQIQITVFFPVNFYRLFFQINFIHFFPTSKKKNFYCFSIQVLIIWTFLFRLPKHKSPLLLLFQKSVVIFINYIKIILHNRLFNFKDRFQNPQFKFFSFQKTKKKKRSTLQHIFFSALYMLQNVLIVHFLFQLCTCSGMCLLYSYIIHMSRNSILSLFFTS